MIGREKYTPTTLMLFGSGIDSKGQPSHNTLRRADTGLDYFHVVNSITRIICSGAYSRSMDNPPEHTTEAQCMADYLVQNGVSAGIVEVEDESQDTFFNIINAIEGGYLTQDMVDAQHPVGMVGNGLHMRRARLIAQQALGASKRSLHIVTSHGEFPPSYETVKTIGFEVAGYALTNHVLADAEPSNLNDTHAAAEQFESIAGGARILDMFHRGDHAQAA